MPVRANIILVTHLKLCMLHLTKAASEPRVMCTPVPFPQSLNRHYSVPPSPYAISYCSHVKIPNTLHCCITEILRWSATADPARRTAGRRRAGSGCRPQAYQRRQRSDRIRSTCINYVRKVISNFNTLYVRLLIQVMTRGGGMLRI